GKSLAGHFHGGALLPGRDDVEHAAGISAFGPQHAHWTGDLAGTICSVVLEIDGSAGAVILASRVDGGGIFEAAQIFSIRFRRDGLRNQSGETAAQMVAPEVLIFAVL